MKTVNDSENYSFIPDPALTSAIEKYVKGLSDDDKAAFQSAGDIMSKIQELDEANTQNNLARTFGARIENTLQVMKRFTACVAPCVQSLPEGSLVVGGLNCVLVVRPGIIYIGADKDR